MLPFSTGGIWSHFYNKNAMNFESILQRNFFYIGRGGKYTIQYTATNPQDSHKPTIQPQITKYSI